jgi:hypothetical protein
MKHNLSAVTGIHVWANYRLLLKTPQSQEEAEIR